MDRFVVSLVDDRNNVVAQRAGCTFSQVPDALQFAMKGAARLPPLQLGWKVVVMRDETMHNEHFTPDEIEEIGARIRSQ